MCQHKFNWKQKFALHDRAHFWDRTTIPSKKKKKNIKICVLFCKINILDAENVVVQNAKLG